jgi:hypothetical protein
VPRDEPDAVNDVEAAIEHLDADDAAQAQVTLLVGNQRSHIVPTNALQSLVEARVQADRALAARHRSLAPGEYRLFRDPADPQRLPCLALRLPCASVAALGDAELAPFVEALGAHTEEPHYRNVRAVYLVADLDDVRIEADPFFQDLAERWTEEQERRELATQISTQREERLERERREADRAAEAAKKPVRVAAGPLRRGDPPTWRAEANADARVNDGESAPDSPGLAELKSRLVAAGFDTLARPGHGIDLAAERAEGFPRRLIAFAPERLTEEVAKSVLKTVKELDADQALVVCEEADAEARRKFIATRAKWITVAQVADLRL